MLYLPGKSLSQIAIRWLLQKQEVSSVIIGAKSVQQLEDNLGASDGWQLSSDQVENQCHIKLLVSTYQAILMALRGLRYS